MWGVGLCCRITLVPALPKEQVGARLQRSCALSAAGIKRGARGWGEPVGSWLPAWRGAACLGKGRAAFQERPAQGCLRTSA